MNEVTISRRGFVKAASVALAGPAFAAPPLRLPNIVVLLADDLGYGDLGCYNPASRIATPNLDRLASGGMRFTHAHTPSAVCTPTRYGLLTGRYCWRTRLQQGVLDGFDPPLIERGRMTVAALLKKRGYSTACVGKWHLGMQWTRKDGTPVGIRDSAVAGFRGGEDVDYARATGGGPNAAGFDWYYGISASLDMSPYCFIENDRVVGVPGEKMERQNSLFLSHVAGVKTKGFELSGVLPTCTKKAVEYIRGRRGAKPPFFLYVPFSAPHLPVVPNQEFEQRSKAGQYGDFVAELDASAGSILDALEKAGFAANTLVIFTSDNGGLWHWWDFKEQDDVALGRTSPRGKEAKSHGHQSNGPLRGTKADIWEGGHRVPFIARWPGKIKAGAASDAPVSLVDVMATCAEITGVRLPDNAAEDSFSMAPALLGRKPATPVRDHIVCHSLRGEFSIQQGEWKLMPHRGSAGFSTPREVQPKPGEPEGQLYNLRQDPEESRNVYSGHSEVVQRLGKLLDKVRREGRSRPPNGKAG